MKTTIVAIDYSLSNTAVFVGSDVDAVHETFGSDPKNYKPNANEVNMRMQRWDDFVANIMSYVTLQTAKATDVRVVIESYSFHSQGNSIYTGESGGLLRWHLTDVGSVHEVPPATLKLFAANNGYAKKVEVAAALTRRWDAPQFRTDDEYDAFGLLLMGLIRWGGVDAKVEYERQAIAKTLGTD